MVDHRVVADVLTGEILNIPPPKPKRQQGWVRMFQLNLEELSKDEDLRGMPKDVFLYMVSKMDYTNCCRVPQVKLAREFGTSAPYMSKIIKLLKDKEIIEEVKEVGEMKYYKFNTKYVCKGKMDKGSD